jgi:hypothetical protein
MRHIYQLMNEAIYFSMPDVFLYSQKTDNHETCNKRNSTGSHPAEFLRGYYLYSTGNASQVKKCPAPLLIRQWETIKFSFLH